MRSPEKRSLELIDSQIPTDGYAAEFGLLEMFDTSDTQLLFNAVHRFAAIAEQVGEYETAVERWRIAAALFPAHMWLWSRLIEVAVNAERRDILVSVLPNLELAKRQGATTRDLEELVVEAPFDFYRKNRAKSELSAAERSYFRVLIRHAAERSDRMRSFVQKTYFLRNRLAEDFDRFISLVDSCCFAEIPSNFVDTANVAAVYLALAKDEPRPDFESVFRQFSSSFSLRNVEQILSNRRNLELVLDKKLFETLYGGPGQYAVKLIGLLKNCPAWTIDLRDTEESKLNQEISKCSPSFNSKFHVAKRKKLAVCISGQLRGFESAFRSWQTHLLNDLDHDVFISTWIDRGGKAFEAAHLDRLFSGFTLGLVSNEIFKSGVSSFRLRYPKVVDLFGRAQRVDEVELLNFTNATRVDIQDHRAREFAGYRNQDFMEYKIGRCFSLMEHADCRYDFLLRIRPDKICVRGQLRPLLDGVDDAFNSGRKVYTDDGFGFQYWSGWYVGDQVALATVEAMKTYSSVREIARNLNNSGIRRGFEEGLTIGHRSLAYVLAARDISAATLPVTWGGFQEVARPSLSEIRQALLFDAAGRLDETDRRFLDALAKDEAESPADA